MIKKSLLLLVTFSLLISFKGISQKVATNEALQVAIKNAKPGDEIILANKVWKDIKIEFIGNGTKDHPIILKAETPGKVFLEGQSSLEFAGEYLIASGLTFQNGYSPLKSVITFKIGDNIANHCTLTGSVIENYTQPNRYDVDHWVDFWGRHNSLDHCYIAGKFNKGPTVVVNLEGNEQIRNYHQITNNHFGPKPRKGGPSGETIRIGNSFTSMAPSYVNVSNNLFDRCNGEIEIISSKSNFNTFRNNVFYESEGSLVMRHGNYCIVDGNVFIGNNKPFMGGIRVINTGHWITNNYFYQIIGEEFRSAVAIMNGIPKSPLNRYNQVTDVVVAHNSFIDCKSPWQLSVGTNINKKDILPAQEIRSARPLRTLIANNLIYNTTADNEPIVTYDVVDGVTFKNNWIDNQNTTFESYDGIDLKAIPMKELSEGLFAPADAMKNDLANVFNGFEFETITTDLFGNSRANNNAIGAIIPGAKSGELLVDNAKYGVKWYPTAKNTKSKKINSTPKDDIAAMVERANDGDIISLKSGTYKFSTPIHIDKKITITSQSKKAKLVYTGPANTPAFQLNGYSHLTVKNIALKGENTQFAFATLEKDMFNVYSLAVDNVEIENFKNVMKAYRGSFADDISFTNTSIENCENGIELAAEIDNKGDYNTEYLSVTNCEFKNVEQNVINYYRGGYDESTIGGNLLVQNNTITNCGGKDESKTLINTTGIVNVAISKNTFKNNPVTHIAVLWGEKNNTHSTNTIENSGEIVVEKYLKQKLMY